MSIVSPGQPKKFSFVDFVFALFALTLIFMILVPANSSLYNSIRTMLGASRQCITDAANVKDTAIGLLTFQSVTTAIRE